MSTPIDMDDPRNAIRLIAIRDAVLDALICVEYIQDFGFLKQALAGNETTIGAQVLHRELTKAQALLAAVLAS